MIDDEMLPDAPEPDCNALFLLRRAENMNKNNPLDLPEPSVTNEPIKIGHSSLWWIDVIGTICLFLPVVFIILYVIYNWKGICQ